MPSPLSHRGTFSLSAAVIVVLAMGMRRLSLGSAVVLIIAVWAWANHPPRAHSIVIFTEPGRSVEVTLLGEDPDGDPLAFELLDPVHFGKLVGAGSHFHYQPNPGFAGTERFSFRVIDPYGAFDVGYVEIRVTWTLATLQVFPLATSEGQAFLAGFLVEQGVNALYAVDMEARVFRPGIIPFVFASPHAQPRVFVVGPEGAPAIRDAAPVQKHVFAADLRQAEPGKYFFLVIEGDKAFSYPFRIELPKPNIIVAHTG